MAIEILIRLYDGTGGRMSGDIVSVKQYPCLWGAGEGLPDYAIIRVVNFSVADFSPYHKRHYSEIIDGVEYEVRSRYRVVISSLPANIRNALFNNGFYEFLLGSNLLSRLEQRELVAV